MLVVGTMLAGLGFVLLSFTPSYVLFVLVFMGPLTVGFQGFNHATMASVNHWFRRQRGLAMSIVQTGQAIGGVVIFPLVALAVLKLGWRPAAFLSGLVVLMLLPLVLLIRDSPESMGLLPDGERPTAHDPSAGAVRPEHRPDDMREFTAREALRTRAFWLLAVLFACGEGINSVTWALVGDLFGRRHFATIRGWIGMLQSIASIPGAVFTGWIYDQTQSYTYALIPFTISYSVAALALWRLPHPQRLTRLQVPPRQALSLAGPSAPPSGARQRRPPSTPPHP